jgi:flagellar motor switch protein FliG
MAMTDKPATPAAPPAAPAIPELTGVDRAAIFMINLSNEDAANIMKFLSPKQIQKLTTSMAKLQDVSKAMLNSVMQEYITLADSQTALGIGNDEHIRNMLNSALGEEKAGAMLDKILSGENTKGLDTLKWIEARQVAEIIRLEHPQIQSIILSYLEPDQAAEVLKYFDEKGRLDLILRISDLDSIHPVALRELNDILEKQFSGNNNTSTRQLGGVQTAANLMNFLDSGIEAELMTSLKERDPELGQSIQDLMFVFDNLIDVDDKGMQSILREVSSDVLILALKGANSAVKNKVFGNMSKRAADLLRDDLEAKGPVKISEVEAAQKEIIATARRMAEAGEISLGAKGGEEMI